MNATRKILLLLGTILCLLFVTEGILQLFPNLTTSVPLTSAYHAPCFVPGTYYWFRLKPSTICTVTSTYNAFPPFTMSANSMGLRNPEITAKPINTKRALFLGDSFAMGWGVTQEQAYPNQSAVFYNAQHPNTTLEAVNAGLVHTAIGYEYVFLKNEFDRIEPDIVVLGFYPFNDIFDTQYSSTWTKVDKQGLPDKIDSKASYIDANGSLRTTYSDIVTHIPFFRNSKLLLLASVAVSKLKGSAVKEPPETYLRICIYKPQCHELDDAKDRIKRLFRAIHSITTERHIPLLVVINPAEFIVFKGVRFAKYGIPYTLTPEEKAYPNKEFENFFTGEGILYLNLLSVFSTRPIDDVYFQNDDHWTPIGHALAGEAVARRLHELLDTKTTP